VQRPDGGAAGERALGFAGGRPRVIEPEVDERVQARVARFDPFDRGVEHFDRRQLAAPDPTGQIDHRCEGQLVSRRHAASPPIEASTRDLPVRTDPDLNRP
jgi:hypothetical protein